MKKSVCRPPPGAFIVPSGRKPLLTKPAVSTLTFAVPEPGYYLLGSRFTAEEGVDFDGPAFTLLLRDESGSPLYNVLEDKPLGYCCSVRYGGDWSMPILGLWNLPQGEVTMTLKSGPPEFMIIDYFFLLPVIIVDDMPSVIMPVSPPAWQDAAGDPIPFYQVRLQAPLPGTYILYALLTPDWSLPFEPRKQHRLHIEVEQGETMGSGDIVQAPDTSWDVARLGPLHLDEGEATVRYESQESGPEQGRVIVESILVVPQGMVARKLPAVEGRWEETPVIDGLADDWDGMPTITLDPEGDSAGVTDIREIKGFTRGGYLHLMVDLYRLAEHSHALLQVDWNGEGDPAVAIDLPPRLGAMGEVHNAAIGEGFFTTTTKSVAFEVIELKVPLSFLKDRTEFYVRYLLLSQTDPEPVVIDETDWALVGPLR